DHWELADMKLQGLEPVRQLLGLDQLSRDPGRKFLGPDRKLPDLGRNYPCPDQNSHYQDQDWDNPHPDRNYPRQDLKYLVQRLAPTRRATLRQVGKSRRRNCERQEVHCSS
uniref:Uncharacterized protein n=1 Tax=Plectus sambesii TaxID=2011161 RepID=A0A914VRQ3_9BILA